jgi:hypothetical protein
LFTSDMEAGTFVCPAVTDEGKSTAAARLTPANAGRAVHTDPTNRATATRTEVQNRTGLAVEHIASPSFPADEV